MINVMTAIRIKIFFSIFNKLQKSMMHCTILFSINESDIWDTVLNFGDFVSLILSLVNALVEK